MTTFLLTLRYAEAVVDPIHLYVSLIVPYARNARKVRDFEKQR